MKHLRWHDRAGMILLGWIVLTACAGAVTKAHAFLDLFWWLRK